MWISVINDKPYKEIEYRLFGKGNEDEYDVPVGARDIIYDFRIQKRLYILLFIHSSRMTYPLYMMI